MFHWFDLFSKTIFDRKELSKEDVPMPVKQKLKRWKANPAIPVSPYTGKHDRLELVQVYVRKINDNYGSLKTLRSLKNKAVNDDQKR